MVPAPHDLAQAGRLSQGLAACQRSRWVAGCLDSVDRVSLLYRRKVVVDGRRVAVPLRITRVADGRRVVASQLHTIQAACGRGHQTHRTIRPAE